MLPNTYRSLLVRAGLAISPLLLSTGAALAQQQVNLSAGPATANLPDGSLVPMWGYSCGGVTGTPIGTAPPTTCGALNPTAASALVQPAWSPVVITVPTGQDLNIVLTNNLPVPTSLVIVGQLGGGLGSVAPPTGGVGATYKASPAHAIQGTTWPIAGDTNGPTFTPPQQGPRVQSFATEVLPTASATLTWTAPRPGTYLLESGTHPSIQGPMGLYGIVVVTTAPVVTATGTTPGTAYPGVSYAAEVPLLLSEIDAYQNQAVLTAVNTPGFSETAVNTLRDQVGSVIPAVDANGNVINAGSGYVVGDPVTISSGGGSGATAQVATVDSSGAILTVTVLTAGSGYTSTPIATAVPHPGGTMAVLSVGLALSANTMGHCYDGTTPVPACYPPAVNYTPLYYLVNGVPFDKTHAFSSLFPTTPSTGVAGNVLVRIVNAGSRMHVPSIVGSLTTPSVVPTGVTPVPVPGFSLIAEDGNPLPGVSRVQSDIFLAAGKAGDVMVNAPAACVPVPPATTCTTPALAIYDRELSLSSNAIARDAGMLAYIGVNGGDVPSTVKGVGATANPDTYNSVIAGKTLAVTDPGKGVIANDVNIYGVKIVVGGVAKTGPVAGTNGTLTLNGDGTFQYAANATATVGDAFTYCGNGSVSGTPPLCTTLTLGAAPIEAASGIHVNSITYTANGTFIKVQPPGILSVDSDDAGYPLTVAATPAPAPQAGLTLAVDPNGGFSASIGSCTPAVGSTVCPYTFTYYAQNSQGTVSSSNATVTINFQPASNLQVTVKDPVCTAAAALATGCSPTIADYRWIIEEDRTFYVDHNCTKNPVPAGCPTATPQGAPAVFGTNFHTSHMPLVATGCTGQKSCESGQTLLGAPTVCDVGNGVCRPDATGNGFAPSFPSQVHLDPKKRYYLSVLPGDSANPFNAGYAGPPDCSAAGLAAGSCGHGMGGVPVLFPQTINGVAPSVTVLTQPSPYPPAKLTVFVFEDDFPLNGEHDAGGGIDVISPNEPGLGSFQITLFDDAGGTGDATGQPTYDMFNMPLTNSLAGTIDPATGLDACPISPVVTNNVAPNAIRSGTLTSGTQGTTVCTPDAPCTCTTSNPCTGDGSQKGIVGMIVTCPTYESDGKTLSPLAGQAVVTNLYQGRYGVVATPGADRIARGEEWLQTNTLDGQKAHDSFMRIGEPAYFQEYGPAGYHVSIGFANPKIINDRKAGVCSAPGVSCTNEVKGHVTTARMSRVPDERLYGSGTGDSFSFTQCYASLGDPDGADFAFVKCQNVTDANGNNQRTFDFQGIPAGNWKITVFDQWNDQIVDGIMQPVGVSGSNTVVDMGEIAVHQWQANIYTRSFIDKNGNGVSDKDAQGNDLEPGLALVSTNIRFRDGSFSNFNNTDLNGYAGFNEVFPLFSWYVIETDTTRYKTTGVHVVYDTGGPVDGSSPADPAHPGGLACSDAGAPFPCGSSSIGQNMANTYEKYPLPADLSVPGAVYCTGADCAGQSIATGPVPSSTTNHSSGRIDPPFWWGSYGWQGFTGQNSFLEFGKKPYAAGETGGIHGHVVYASTRPFDDPQLLLQLSWEPLVPHVRVNLYKEGFAADGVTPTLTLIDHTETSSFDDWAQGFRLGADGVNKVVAADGISYVPNVNCPGQAPAPTSTTPGDLFFFSLRNQPQWLDYYNNGAGSTTALPYQAQYKCYDGMHNWNQLQPAPYDGMYGFPSVTAVDPTTGKPTRTNCTACATNPDSTDPYRFGAPMLPPGKYVVEVVVPPGYELVKEEDKNILIGDNFIAPVTQQFAGLGNIYILPDQAEVAAFYNSTNPQNPTTTLGRASSLPSHEGDTGSVESFWPCVGTMRTVPDYISLYPQSAEVSPFAGASRPLCDRKEVTLTDQSAALAKFYIFTSTHVASHFTGLITDDFTAEFDPFSPQFGEKFAPAYLPVSIKDWTGAEIGRTYSDQWGAYNGLNYSTWEVNPPNPTGYGPTMMIMCMNDAGSGTSSPWWDPAAGSGTSVKPDPLFQPGYSQFCYHLPFMPGQTGYFDTPVVPNTAFSEGYNHPDCNYADTTPAIKSVTSADAAGPWVSAVGHTLTITSLGDQPLDWYGYSGPSVTTPPFNAQKITRHYGFGATKGTVQFVGLNANGAPATVTVPSNTVTWSDTTISFPVPTGVPPCRTTSGASNQQQAQYGGPGTPGVGNTLCGELVITAANGKTSVDTVTVTVGGKRPTVLASGQTIQSAIDAASPGDMIIVPPGLYHELLLMWKPVRLQGVGAASAIIDANPHPAGKLTPWRQQVNCLFGLTPDGRPRDNPADTGCSTGWAAASGGPNFPTMIVDRVPTEGIMGWDATLNGNLAEQLIEPSIMGAYEGAGITVLAKGVNIPAGAPDAWGTGAEAAFPAGTVLLTQADCTGGSGGTNPYPGNFYCNPSSIDGLGVTNSSQGGGGILVHGWAHNLVIANNRVFSNTGTLAGGIGVGQGEHIETPLAGEATTIPPGSCETSAVPNLGLPFCYNMRVNVHHNAVTLNASMGDELFSSTPAGAGGVNFANGSDYYRFSYNWVCGNMSTGDGGGISHIGWSKNALIEHNSILFNQSTNPTITTNGGGVLVMGAPDPDPTCANNNDKDCVPSPIGSIGPSDGTGPGLVINANLILGNSADSGSGGGLRLQHLNGTDVLNFPNGASSCPSGSIRSIDTSPTAPQTCYWNSVSVTNNIIANNVAGWDGAGASLLDALAVNMVNNTIIDNDATASSGALFNSLFAPLASSVDPNYDPFACHPNNTSQSCPQVAGLVSVLNSPVLQANLPAAGFSCPPLHGNSGSCRYYSAPALYNNLIWKNRSFIIGVGDFGTGTTNQQKVVSLFDAFTNAAAPSQPQTDSFTTDANGGLTITGGTGACGDSNGGYGNVRYWEIGVRGDLGPNNHVTVNGTQLRLSPTYSWLTDSTDYTGANNSGSTSTAIGLFSQYCNGSRVPPELGSMGYQVPPGTNETNALPTPVFSLTPSATVDEGNNWINIRWGPLALTNPASGETLGNYGPASSTSPVVGYVPSTATVAYGLAPSTDFFGTARKPGSVDAGAVEFTSSAVHRTATVSPSPLAFGNWATGTTSNARTLTVTNTGTALLTGGTFTFGGGTPQPFSRATAAQGGPGTCGTSLAPGASCTFNVVFAPTTATTFNRTLTVAYTGATVTPSPVQLTGTGVASRAPVAIAPNPLSITLASGVNSGVGTVTLTNTAPAAGAQMTVSAVAVSSPGGSATTWSFSVVPGEDLCTGATLAPNAACTVGVSFTSNAGTARGVTRNGTITFTDNGAGSPQTGALQGFANVTVLATP